MKYCSAIKGNEVLIPAIARMGLKDNMLSERSQPHKATHCMIPMISNRQIGQFKEKENRLVMPGGGMRTRMRILLV